jgi:hypothetical protein
MPVAAASIQASWREDWMVAWAGKPSSRQKTAASVKSRTAPHPMPKLKSDNPNGVPTEIMKQLSQEGLSSDPAAFNRRLQQLLAAYKLNGG